MLDRLAIDQRNLHHVAGIDDQRRIGNAIDVAANTIKLQAMAIAAGLQREFDIGGTKVDVGRFRSISNFRS